MTMSNNMPPCPRCGAMRASVNRANATWVCGSILGHGGTLSRSESCYENEREQMQADLGTLTRDHRNAMDLMEAYRAAASKAMAELRLVLPYLPEDTAIHTQRVFDRIEETSPPIPHGEYMYCAQCGEQHEQSAGVIDGKCQLLQKRQDAAKAAKEKDNG